MAKRSLSSPGQGWLDKTLSYGGGATATPAPTAAPAKSQWWQTPAGSGSKAGGITLNQQGSGGGTSENFMSLGTQAPPTGGPVAGVPKLPTTGTPPPATGVVDPVYGQSPPRQFGVMNGYNPNLGRPTGSQFWQQQRPGDPVIAVPDLQDKVYYTGTNPSAFWQQAGKLIAGNNANFLDFWNAKFSAVQAAFWQAAEKNDNLQWPDFVTGLLADQIWQEYQLLSPEQRGSDPRAYDPGRFDTSR